MINKNAKNLFQGFTGSKEERFLQKKNKFLIINFNIMNLMK